MSYGPLVLLLATSGCEAATGPGSGATVEAVDRQQDIAITNRTPRPIYTFVVGRQAAALINWALCVSGTSCAPLPPGETRRAPYPTTLLSSAEREVLVYWWYAVRGSDGRLRPGSLHVEIVTLERRGSAWLEQPNER